MYIVFYILYTHKYDWIVQKLYFKNICTYILLSIENIMFIIACDDTRLHINLSNENFNWIEYIWNTTVCCVFKQHRNKSHNARDYNKNIIFLFLYKHMIMILIFRDDDDDDDAFAQAYKILCYRAMYLLKHNRKCARA